MRGFILLVAASFSSYALATSLPSVPSFNISTTYSNGSESTNEVGVPPGVTFTKTEFGTVALNQLHTNYFIVRTMSVLGQRNQGSNIRSQEIYADPRYQDVAIRVLPEPGESMRVDAVLWALSAAQTDLTEMRGDNFVIARIRVFLYGHPIGYVNIAKRMGNTQPGTLTLTDLDGSYSTRIDSAAVLEKRIATTSGKGQQSTTATPVIWISSDADEEAIFASNQTLAGNASSSANEETLLVAFDFVSTINLGQNQLYLTYSNVILGLLASFDRDYVFRIRRPDLGTVALISPPDRPRRTAPFNTRARSIHGVALTAFWTTRAREYKELEGSIAVGQTQIMEVSYKRLT